MSAWVKFHEELTQGEKRSMPRSVRFVFMELSLKCRARRGEVELRRGVPTCVSVHELLGAVTKSDQKEVNFALDLLTQGPDPWVVIVETDGHTMLRIPSWGDWNSVDKSAERMKKLRAAKAEPKAHVTRHSDGGAPSRDGGVTALDKRRGEEIRVEENPPKPPQGGAGPAGRGDGQGTERLTGPESARVVLANFRPRPFDSPMPAPAPGRGQGGAIAPVVGQEAVRGAASVPEANLGGA